MKDYLVISKIFFFPLVNLFSNQTLIIKTQRIMKAFFIYLALSTIALLSFLTCLSMILD